MKFNRRQSQPPPTLKAQESFYSSNNNSKSSFFLGDDSMSQPTTATATTDGDGTITSNRSNDGSYHHHHQRAPRHSSAPDLAAMFPPRSSVVSTAGSTSTVSTTTTTTTTGKQRVVDALNVQGRQRLAEMTINKLKFDRVGLVGRSQEAKEIQQIFPLQSKHLLLISGDAGTGKSRLVQQTLRPLLQKQQQQQNSREQIPLSDDDSSKSAAHAFLLWGKHLQQGDKPYAGVTACCEDLSHQIIANSSRAELEDLQKQFQAELGLEAAVLTSLIPGLLPIIGVEPEEEQPLLAPIIDEEDEEDDDDNENEEKDKQRVVVESTTPAPKTPPTTTRKRPVRRLLLPDKTTASGSNGPGRGGGGAVLRGSSSSMSVMTTAGMGGGKYLEARLRFNNAFRRFMRVLCRYALVVWVIDDLQWCDEPSFHLLEHVLKDRHQSQYLIVGTFRPSEVDEKHHLTKFRHRLQKAAEADPYLDLSYIKIGNFQLDAVLEMLVELLSVNEKKATPLAECVLHKTHGNAFFIVQFLTILQQRELIKFNFGTLAWTWDLQEIDQKTEATDNVADFVRSKMEILPRHLRHVLPLLGSLGTVFDQELFLMVMQHVRGGSNTGCIATTTTTTTTPTWKEDDQDCPTNEEIIQACVDEGLIERFGDASYRWIHDKVEEAALALIPPDELHRTQFELARSLFQQMNEQQVSQNIFVLVYLFRTSHSILPPNDPLRAVIAKLRLESGLQAFRGAAYDQAAVELHHGMELMQRNSDAWQTEYDLNLQLYSTAAEANLCIGELDAVEECVATLLRETENQPLLHRRRGYNALVRSYLANGRYEKACELLSAVLAKLGVKFGGKLAATAKIITKLVRIKKNATKNAFAISNLPPMTDEMDSWAIFLLDRLAVTFYQMQSPLLALAILISFEKTLEGGIVEISPNIIASAGLLCAIGLQDYDAAKLYAVEALELVKGMNSKYSEAQTSAVAHHFALIHSLPVEDLRKGLLQGYDAGMANGDSEFACWCMDQYIEQTFVSGVALESVIQLAKDHTREANDLNQQPAASVAALLWQVGLNLTGRSENPLIFTGDAMNEEEWLANNFGIGHWNMHFVRYKIHVCVLYGAYDVAMEWILKEKVHQGAMEKAFPGTYTNCVVTFHCAVAAISMARKVKKRSRFYRSLARQFGRMINAWTDKGSPNVKHYNALLTAELADLKGDTDNANEWFQRAIALSARRGFLLDRGLAHERYGDFYLRQSDMDSAKYHYNLSITAYKDWGAVAKVKRLEEQYLYLLQPSSTLVITFPPTLAQH